MSFKSSSITVISGLLAIAAIGYSVDQISQNNHEKEPILSGEYQESDLIPQVKVVNLGEPGVIDRGIAFETGQSSQESDERQVTFTTIANSNDENLFLLVHDQARAGGTNLENLCNNPSLGETGRNICHAQFGARQVVPIEVDGSQAQVPIYLLQGGEWLIPYQGGSFDSLLLGNLVLTTSELESIIYDEYAQNGFTKSAVIEKKDKIILTPNLLRTFLPIPTAEPTIESSQPDTSIESTPSTATNELPNPIENKVLIRQAPVEVSTIEVTLEGGREDINLYALDPTSIIWQNFIRFGEMLGHRPEDAAEFLARVTKEINKLETKRFFGKILPVDTDSKSVSKIELAEGETRNLRVVLEFSANSGTSFLLADENNLPYFQITGDKNAAQMSFTALDANRQPIHNISEILNLMKTKQLTEHSPLDGAPLNAEKGYFIDPWLQASLLSQLGSTGDNYNLLRQAIEIGQMVEVLLLKTDGTTVPILIPSGVPFAMVDTDPVVTSWDSENNPLAPDFGATYNEKYSTYARVPVSLIFGGEDFPKEIPDELMTLFKQELAAKVGSDKEVILLVPLNVILPQVLLDTNFDKPASSTSSSTNFFTIHVPLPTLNSSGLNRIVLTTFMTNVGRNNKNTIINSKKWSEMQYSRISRSQRV